MRPSIDISRVSCQKGPMVGRALLAGYNRYVTVLGITKLISPFHINNHVWFFLLVNHTFQNDTSTVKMNNAAYQLAPIKPAFLATIAPFTGTRGKPGAMINIKGLIMVWVYRDTWHWGYHQTDGAQQESNSCCYRRPYYCVMNSLKIVATFYHVGGSFNLLKCHHLGCLNNPIVSNFILFCFVFLIVNCDL